jgi:hypothetical protein
MIYHSRLLIETEVNSSKNNEMCAFCGTACVSEGESSQPYGCVACGVL